MSYFASFIQTKMFNYSTKRICHRNSKRKWFNKTGIFSYSPTSHRYGVISYNPNFLSRKPTAQPQPQPLYPKLVKSKIIMYIMNTTYNIIKDKNLNSILSSFLSRWWIFVFSYAPKHQPHLISVQSSHQIGGSGTIRLSIGAIPTRGFSRGLGVGAQKPSIFSGWLTAKPTQHPSQRLEQALEYLDLDVPSPGTSKGLICLNFGYCVWVFHLRVGYRGVEDKESVVLEQRKTEGPRKGQNRVE